MKRFTYLCLVGTLAISATAHAAHAITIDTVPIGNPGNPADTEVMVCCDSRTGTSGYGTVGYSYRIGKTEVTIAQYVEFLNAVAASDPYLLFYTSASVIGIVRSGTSGSYTYAVQSPTIGQGPGGSDYTYDNKPVRFVTWYSAIRFANWLQNGQGGPETTEDGAYTLLGGTSTPSNAQSITRNPGASWWIPSEDEWYKAAYYDPLSAVYYDYPTGTDSVPNNNLPANDTGNSANFYQNGNTTGNQLYPLTDAGAYTLSGSPYGTFDQGGNVFEWNEALIESFNRGIRGGYWGGRSDILPSSVSASGNPRQAGSFYGFRVATVPELPGDFNNDGTVDAADYTVWRDTLGQTGTGLAADGDGNGTVNTLDYDFWKSHFGNHAGSGAVGTAAVPEPASLLLSVVAVVGMAFLRHRL